MARLRVINIVDSIDPMNIGIWGSVIINASNLKAASVESELWFPRGELNAVSVLTRQLVNTSASSLTDLIVTAKLDPERDLIVTHGLWHYPTRWGFHLSSLGFKWIYVPHGMLEPWPLQQKWLKKKLYFNLVESRLVKKADIIRAVSKPEALNLAKLFPKSRIEYIPNGVVVNPMNDFSAATMGIVTRYLFMSRLHRKKNVVTLAHAWIDSSLNNDRRFELTIAGPDQGELVKLQPILAKSDNIKYVGVISGATKEQYLNSSTFYVLPSYSEGLPSAVLEAMSSGIIPIITEGCNFPDVFEFNIGVKVTTEKLSIQSALEDTSRWNTEQRSRRRIQGRRLIQTDYSIEAVTKKQLQLFLEE